MTDEKIPHLAAPEPDKATSPIVEEVVTSSCEWNGDTYPEWYKHCVNGRVYQCLDGRWRNTGNSCR